MTIPHSGLLEWKLKDRFVNVAARLTRDNLSSRISRHLDFFVKKNRLRFFRTRTHAPKIFTCSSKCARFNSKGYLVVPSSNFERLEMCDIKTHVDISYCPQLLIRQHLDVRILAFKDKLKNKSNTY